MVRTRRDSQPMAGSGMRLRGAVVTLVICVLYATIVSALTPAELMQTDESTLAMARQEALSVDMEAQAIESLVQSIPRQTAGNLPVHASFKQMFPFASGGDSSSSSGSTSDSESSESGEQTDRRFVTKMLKVMKQMAKHDDPEEDAKLDEALNTIKSQIVFKAKTIKGSKEWVKSVTKLVDVYVKKVRRVHAHARQLVNDYQLLQRKKRQIENMILQRALEKRLKSLQGDLKVIHGALENIQGKQTLFSKSKSDIKTTIGAMDDFLTRLRTKRDNESQSESSMGESSAESSSSQSSSSSSSSSQSSSGNSQQSQSQSQSRQSSGQSGASSQSTQSKKGKHKEKPTKGGSKASSKQVKSGGDAMQTLTFSFSEVNSQDDPNALS